MWAESRVPGGESDDGHEEGKGDGEDKRKGGEQNTYILGPANGNAPPIALLSTAFPASALAA
jgi:hypothetical protein